ncbi:hypothetical protein H4R18_003441 [Coemansia javaensis]|uniref:Uncharacterized protein n=1 Tax=Coemansia javaensis TaxID=2761396 RepID=A0A9W8HC32_9FUNG|nr:hypothetical protein H4R18_003441 [Coemansia javaensis]
MNSCTRGAFSRLRVLLGGRLLPAPLIAPRAGRSAGAWARVAETHSPPRLWTRALRTSTAAAAAQQDRRGKGEGGAPDGSHHERVATIPNALTMARILSAPYIGYLVVQGDAGLALAGCVVFGLTDALDGYIARRYDMKSFVGSILDPAADKVLMTTLTAALAYVGLLPTTLAAVIIGRDVALSLAAFVVRWATLPPPKTARRYFDLSIPSVEVRPTQLSKWNTALQLLLVSCTLAAPVLSVAPDCVGLVALQWATGATTVASGIGYLTSRDAVHRLTKAEVARRMPRGRRDKP